MTEDEARKLAQRCIDTWPAGPKGYIWRDALLPLDAHYAAAAYRRMSTEQDRPTVARFIAEYHALMPRGDAPAHTIDRGAISLGEYLERVQLRALKGDHEAQSEMDRWTRHLGAEVRRRPPTPAEAQRRIEQAQLTDAEADRLTAALNEEGL